MKRFSIALVITLIGLLLGFSIAKTYTSLGLRKTPLTTVPQPTEPIVIASSAEFPIRSWNPIEDFEHNFAIFETVFWDPRDTISLRQLIREGNFTEGKTVLEIGTGSGLLALCCLKAGAKKAIATDVNGAAIANANFNADRLELADRLDARLVPLENSSAFSVIAPDEKFDLIISNPPWVNRQPQTIDEYALYDANFALMKSLFDGLHDHLEPGGKVLLAYGCVDAIKTMQKLAKEHQLGFVIHDTRNLDELPEEFLPGMLIEIKLTEE